MNSKIVLAALSIILLLPMIFGAQFIESVGAGEPPIEIWANYTLTRDITFSSDGFILKADGVVLDLNGHTIRGSGAGRGISAIGVESVTIKSGIVEGFFEGIFLQNSYSNKIKDNIVKKNEWGIFADSSSNNVIESNTVYETTGDGIICPRSHNNIIRKNVAHHNKEGIDVAYPDGTDNIVEDNIVYSNVWYGIHLHKTCDNLVMFNIAYDNTAGIKIEEHAKRNIVKYNYVYENGGGIDMFFNCESNVVTQNLIENNIYGSFMIDSLHNTISENTIRNNQYGIRAICSDSNKIFRNNFVSNTIQAFCEQSTTEFDDGYPSGGNYWSDYEERYPDAEELDGSGIWDTPYVIDENNRDNYPLMKPQQELGTWIELAEAPENIGGGGGVVFHENALYIMAGGGTKDFWKLDVNSLTWTDLRNLPKEVEWGASMAFDGERYIYVVKGSSFGGLVPNNDFWKYDLVQNDWENLQDTPEGVGSVGSVCYADGFVYLRPGRSFSGGFYRYNVELQAWETMESGPIAAIDIGPSCAMDYDGTRFIYTFQGGENIIGIKYDEVWRYDTLDDEWLDLGRATRENLDKADLTYVEGGLYAICEYSIVNFRFFDLSTNTWSNRPDIPCGLGFWNSIGSGASLAYDGVQHIFALNGGNNKRIYCYRIGPSVGTTALHIVAESPVNILVISPDGLRTGYDPATETIVNEIPAIYSGLGTEPQTVSILNPIQGAYTVDVFGTGAGDYIIKMEFVAANGSVVGTETYAGEIVKGAVYAYTASITIEGMTTSPDLIGELEHLRQFIMNLLDVFLTDDPDEFAEFKKEMVDKIKETLEELHEDKYVEAIEKLNDMKEEILDEDKLQPTSQSDLCVIIDHIISSIETLQPQPD